MIDAFIGSGILLATREPGVIVGPIARFLGVIYNGIFNGIYSATPALALGIAIIVFTVIIKSVFFPLSYYQTKSTRKMQLIQPQLKAIQDKYKGQNDRESQMKMNAELQKVQRENGVNMAAGCLPLLVQLPILYALFHIFQQPYLYLDVVAANYSSIADVFMGIPVETRVNVLYNIAMNNKLTMDLAIHGDLIKLINSMSVNDWKTVLFGFAEYTDRLLPLYEQKTLIESFFGISLIYATKWSFPGIIIPIVSGLTTWLSSKNMQNNQQDPNNPMAASMASMNVVMPVVMGIMSATVPAGVGIYWTISNVYQYLSQKIMFRLIESRERKKEEDDRIKSVKEAEKTISDRKRRNDKGGR